MGNRTVEEVKVSAQGYLRRLVDDEGLRGEASDWAAEAMEFLEQEEADPQIHRMLNLLLGADLKESPTSYLYGREDFIAWRDEFASLSGFE